MVSRISSSLLLATTTLRQTYHVVQKPSCQPRRKRKDDVESRKLSSWAEYRHDHDAGRATTASSSVACNCQAVRGISRSGQDSLLTVVKRCSFAVIIQKHAQMLRNAPRPDQLHGVGRAVRGEEPKGVGATHITCGIAWAVGDCSAAGRSVEDQPCDLQLRPTISSPCKQPCDKAGNCLGRSPSKEANLCVCATCLWTTKEGVEHLRHPRKERPQQLSSPAKGESSRAGTANVF